MDALGYIQIVIEDYVGRFQISIIAVPLFLLIKLHFAVRNSISSGRNG
jgi:hypothetical protein